MYAAVQTELWISALFYRPKQRPKEQADGRDCSDQPELCGQGAKEWMGGSSKWNPEFVDVAQQNHATRRVLPLAAHDLPRTAVLPLLIELTPGTLPAT
jgi:hypothetical protein